MGREAEKARAKAFVETPDTLGSGDLKNAVEESWIWFLRSSNDGLVVNARRNHVEGRHENDNNYATDCAGEERPTQRRN